MSLNQDHFFHEIESPADVTSREKSARAFVGDGQGFILTPGLKTLTGIRIGVHMIPLSIKEQWPMHSEAANQRDFQEVDVPLFRLISVDGEPAVQRSLKSNNGVFQRGANVLVYGDWGSPEPAKPSRKAATTTEPVVETEDEKNAREEAEKAELAKKGHGEGDKAKPGDNK